MNRSSRKLFNWKLFDRLAKIFIVIIILGLGLQALYVFRFAAPSTNDSVAGKIDSSLDDESLPADPQQIFADFTSGSWRFGDSDWDFRLFSAAATEASNSLPTAIRVTDSEFDDQSIIDQFKDLGAQPKRVEGGFEAWESTGSGFTMTLFTHEGVVQLIRTKLPVETGITIIEALPRIRRYEETGIMLPLIAGAVQTAVRVDPNGRMTSAIIQLNSEKQIDIRSHWKENGWQVTSALDFDFGDLNGQLANTKFRCTKDGTMIDATFMSESGDPEAVIILTLVTSHEENKRN